MTRPNPARWLRLVHEAVDACGLDLSGRTVLTEAATGPFAVTAVLAAAARADRVLVLARDGAFGTAEEAVRQTLAFAAHAGVQDRMEPLESREDDRLAGVELVTNLRGVRPLDGDLLRRLSGRAVVSLMFEPWEFRADDLDVPFCRNQGLPVAGTDEEHPVLGTMAYVGMIAVKLLLELDLELLRSRVLIVGGGKFGRSVESALSLAGCRVRRIVPPLTSASGLPTEGPWDAVVVCEHEVQEVLVGPGGTALDPHRLSRENPGIALAHIAGRVDGASIRQAGIPHLPEHMADPGYMSVSTAYVGPKPIIDLHAAGLRVGQALADAVFSGARGRAAEAAAARQCHFVAVVD